jgi:hypothetical protein
MSATQVVPHYARSIPFGLRLRVRAAALAAAPLARLTPARLRVVLSWLRRGAAPAGYAEAAELRDATVGVSLQAAGPEGCLRRTLTVALLCRVRGIWPTWCVGVTALPPFGAHSWIEADGRMVGEDEPEGHFTKLIAIPAAT